MPLYIKLRYANYLGRFRNIFKERKVQKLKMYAVILKASMFLRSWEICLRQSEA